MTRMGRWGLLIPAVALGAITGEEAQCIVDGKTTVFFGDSLTRYCYYEFNTFIATGEVRDHELGGASGDGKWSDDYDTWEEWTEKGVCGAGGKHRRHIWKDFGGGTLDRVLLHQQRLVRRGRHGQVGRHVAGGRSRAHPRHGGRRRLQHGLVAVKGLLGGLSLRRGGLRRRCLDWYLDMMTSVVDHLLAKTEDTIGVYRTTACCGESQSGETWDAPGCVTDGWVPSIEAQNAAATGLMEERGIPVVDVFNFYNISTIDDYTFDSRHAKVATCHAWTEMILRAVDREQGSGCVEDLGADYVPDITLIEWPSAQPTSQPSAPTYAPSDAPTKPTYAPSTAPSPSPSEPPSPSPTSAPSAYCGDDDAWHKRSTPSKDCAWVAKAPDLRCRVVGENASLALEACRRALRLLRPAVAGAGRRPRRRRRRPPSRTGRRRRRRPTVPPLPAPTTPATPTTPTTPTPLPTPSTPSTPSPSRGAPPPGPSRTDRADCAFSPGAHDDGPAARADGRRLRARGGVRPEPRRGRLRGLRRRPRRPRRRRRRRREASTPRRSAPRSSGASSPSS